MQQPTATTGRGSLRASLNWAGPGRPFYEYAEKLRIFVLRRRIVLRSQKSILPPPTITKVWFSSYNYKTGYFTSLNFSNRAFYLPRAVFKTVCYSKHSFVFFFLKKISVESLKNHSKTQKNHKIENLILLDSTRVDIRSEYIIWYTLV